MQDKTGQDKRAIGRGRDVAAQQKQKIQILIIVFLWAVQYYGHTRPKGLQSSLQSFPLVGTERPMHAPAEMKLQKWGEKKWMKMR